MGACWSYLPLQAPLDVIQSAKDGNTKGIKRCIRRGRSVNRCDASGRTALHWASMRGHARAVEQLLKATANINVRDSMRYSPLHYAAENNFPELVRILCSHGANVNAQNAMLRTPFHIPAREGYTAVCAALLDAGADHSNLMDIFGRTASELASPEVQLVFKERLRNGGAGSDSCSGGDNGDGSAGETGVGRRCKRLLVVSPLPDRRGARPRKSCVAAAAFGSVDGSRGGGYGGISNGFGSAAGYGTDPGAGAVYVRGSGRGPAYGGDARVAGAANGGGGGNGVLPAAPAKELRAVVISTAVLEAALGASSMRFDGRRGGLGAQTVGPYAGGAAPSTAATLPLLHPHESLESRESSVRACSLRHFTAAAAAAAAAARLPCSSNGGSVSGDAAISLKEWPAPAWQWSTAAAVTAAAATAAAAAAVSAAALSSQADDKKSAPVHGACPPNDPTTAADENHAPFALFSAAGSPVEKGDCECRECRRNAEAARRHSGGGLGRAASEAQLAAYEAVQTASGMCALPPQPSPLLLPPPTAFQNCQRRASFSSLGYSTTSCGRNGGGVSDGCVGGASGVSTEQGFFSDADGDDSGASVATASRRYDIDRRDVHTQRLSTIAYL